MTEDSGTTTGGRGPRLLRGKRGAALAGLLVGALLGAGTVAWRTDTLPLVPRELCWGTLSEDVAFGMFSREGRLEARELPLEHARGNDARVRGECRITRIEDDERRWEVTATVRDLDELHGLDMREWPDAFLSPRMAPLGGEITGMVSPNRAWAALPKGCLSSSGNAHAPRVVDVSAGVEWIERDDDESRRAALARTVVHMVNGLMEKYGCSGRYAEPGDLAPLAETRDAGLDELCGVKGMRLPAADRPGKKSEYSYRERVTPGSGEGVRACDIGMRTERPDIRFMTIEDPDLAQIFMTRAFKGGGEPLKGDGYGRVGGDLSVYTTRCQTGDVVFVVRAFDSRAVDWSRRLLPAYVKSEAKRIGCGDVTVAAK
ncbi:hypothetical protein HHL19_34385 [Streptomyces sp. R302]|uniref:hypothetical protein n=1 Tax=unclassified Streptomyces TaxID=2593676 RepID=UPI00145E6A08|nr:MULTISPECIES: hypothetical protein [unclassified Streptomyces]NML54913.1 hypothetical protein [Streptomyces sp. R301]NML83600.1 hypothetical protein [Streptomyces sp. R302]